MFFWVVSWSEEQGSSLAKPCKPYSTSFKNQRCAVDGLRLPKCILKASILVPKCWSWRLQTAANIYVRWRLLWSLHFSSSWRLFEVEFGFLLACIFADPATETHLFGVLDSHWVFFCTQVVAGPDFGVYFGAFWVVLGCIFTIPWGNTSARRVPHSQ